MTQERAAKHGDGASTTTPAPAVAEAWARGGEIGRTPGAWQQRDAAPLDAVQYKEWCESKLSGMDTGEVHATARAGVEGGGSALPHREQIQQSFGHHDVSNVRAHVGGAAADASSAMGAQAYATGSDVAFASAPSLEIAAHEAAHVVQQRSGAVQLWGGVGVAGDPHEQHADAVAREVVAGRSAQGLLDQYQGGPSTVAVQHKGGKSDADNARDSGYHPEWDQVAGAAVGDEAALAGLDIAWIDGLPGRFLDQIDGHFTKQNEAAAFAKALKTDPRVKAATKSHDTAAKQAKDDAVARLKAAGAKHGKKDIEKEAGYKKDLAAADAVRDEAMDAASDELRPEFDQQRQKDGMEATVVKPPEEGVTWKEGRTLSRANFMAWGLDVFGNADAFKAHYRSMREVSGFGGLWLAGAAADRFEAAHSWFQTAYPGNRFHHTDVGQAMRGRHESTESLGKLGHPLGISIDFKAYENPNQLDGVSQFMLRKFGGETDATGNHTKQGANRIEGADSKTIEAMGQESAAGEDLSEKQEQYLAKISGAFEEMSQTSKNFKNSMKDSMPTLHEAEAQFVAVWASDVAPINAELAELDRKLKPARKTAYKQLDKIHDDKVTAEMVDAEPAVAALLEQVAGLVERRTKALAGVTSTLEKVFAPWIAELQGEVDQKSAGIDQADMDLDIDIKVTGSLVDKVDHAKTKPELVKLLKSKTYKVVFDGIDESLDLHALQAAMKIRAHAVNDAKWAAGEIKTRVELIRRLTDPKAVFGTPEKKGKSKEWKISDKVAEPSVMQYLEKGFVRDDELSTKPGDHKEVFNKEFVTAMMRFGWNCGATWGTTDTMHFDFLEGYHAVQGGWGSKFGPG